MKVLAELSVSDDGKTLEASYVNVYSPDGHIDAGGPEILHIARELKAEARSLGFEAATIEFERISGATPGRTRTMTIELDALSEDQGDHALSRSTWSTTARVEPASADQLELWVSPYPPTRDHEDPDYDYDR